MALQLLAASLTGFLAIGVSASLFDEPRLTLLFFLIVWLAMLNPPRLAGFNRQGSLRQQRGQTRVARP